LKIQNIKIQKNPLKRRVFCTHFLDTHISIDVQYIYPPPTESLMHFIKENWMFIAGIVAILIQAITSCMTNWQMSPPWYVIMGMSAPAFVLALVLVYELHRRS
jgi:hypothetical protein